MNYKERFKIKFSGNNIQTINILKETRENTYKWVEYLRSDGFKAAHPTMDGLIRIIKKLV